MNLLFLKNKLYSYRLQRFTLFLIFLCIGCENQFIENFNTVGKNIALTFDDGPDPLYTGMVLDILREKDVKATFFLVGNKIKQNPQVTERIFKDGHCLANHTYTHIDLKKKSFKVIYSEIQQTEQLLVNVCGESQKLFRPPWGHITDSEKETLKKYGYKIVLWDINSGDYKPNITANKIVRNVMENIAGNKIILFHDSDYQCKASRQNTASALPDIIDSLKALGYNFVTIDKMKIINQ